jgi:hypothetical protein
MQVTLQIGESTTVVQPVAAGKQLGIRACGYPDGTVSVVVKQLDGTVAVSVSFAKGVDAAAYALCDVVEA